MIVRIMWMSVHCEKVSKGRQGFIERMFYCFGQDLRRCLQLFFVNDAGKSCWENKGHNSSFVKDHGNLLLCKKSTLVEKSADSLFCITYLKMPGYCCQRSAFFVTIAVKWSNFFLCRMGKALCEPPFTLHRLKP